MTRPDADATVAFGANAPAPLRSGSYTLVATQKITLGSVVEGYRATRQFSVAGQRFALAPEALGAVYPPDGSQGGSANVLPHAALLVPSLPWQRAPGGAPAQPPPSWLAVLLFDAADPPPTPRTVEARQLAGASGVFFPPVTLESGQGAQDAVTVVDIPRELFVKIAPALADLPLLAHVRCVDTDAKASQGELAPPGEYALVLGNRMPAPGSVSTAHLVSLENYGPYLPGGASVAATSSYQLVRLVSLASWSFGTEGDGEGFAETLLAHTTAGPLQRPVRTIQGAAAADQAVAEACGLGYTALNHGLRNGDTTVSWYRGPLLPQGAAGEVAPPIADADELLRFDPTTGMLDVTYSAAWTLGRLLALRDNAFATALYRWKLTQTQAAIETRERELLHEALDEVAPAGREDRAPGGEGASDSRHALMTRAVQTLGDALDELAGERDER